MAQNSRPCAGCGTAIPRTKPTGPIPPYCGDECKPRCSVEGCGKAVSSKGMCGQHAARARITGDPLTPFERQKNVGACSVEGCRERSRKRGWCASHYAQQQRSGTDPQPFKYRWADLELCKVCGNPPGGGSRVFCSGACAFLWRKYGGKVPHFRECVGCGVRIDLTKRGKGGQRVHAVIKFCRRCRQDYNKYKMTAAQLAERDGTNCGLCSEPVDMTLRRSDPGGVMCPSVDHIIPRSRGGTHEPENLQLAHLYCNQVKSDRVEDVA